MGVRTASLLLGSALLAPAAFSLTSLSLTLAPSDSVAVSDLTTTAALNAVLPQGVASTYPVRSRRNAGQNDRQIVTFVQFDLTPIDTALAANPELMFGSAAFVIDYTQQLNTVNELQIFVGRNTGGSWTSTPGSLPLHDWAFDDETSTVNAADGVLILDSVQNTAPTVADILSDVTPIVGSWVYGANSNDGFVLYYPVNEFQGAGFENVELLVTLIPEPSRALLLGLGVVGLVMRRRR